MTLFRFPLTIIKVVKSSSFTLLLRQSLVNVILKSSIILPGNAADEGGRFVDAVCDVGTADDEGGALDEFEERLLDSDVDEEPFDVSDDTGALLDTSARVIDGVALGLWLVKSSCVVAVDSGTYCRVVASIKVDLGTFGLLTDTLGC